MTVLSFVITNAKLADCHFILGVLLPCRRQARKGRAVATRFFVPIKNRDKKSSDKPLHPSRENRISQIIRQNRVLNLTIFNVS